MDLRSDVTIERHEHLVAPKSVSLAARPSVRRLSPREREVAILVAEGLKDSAIARKLGLSTATVGTYVQRIRTRLHLSSRGEIITWVTERVVPGHPEAGFRRADPERVDPSEPVSEIHSERAGSFGRTHSMNDR
jgi:DNA-binding CsgD family transcriptional regulator